jgi:DNA-binding CsgD family transcriptional regulator
MARSEAIVESVRRIYAAFPERDGWNTVMSTMASAARCPQITFFVHDIVRQRTTFMTGVGISSPGLAAFAAASSGNLPDWRHGIPIARLMPRSRMWADEDYVRTDFYNMAVRPLDVFYGGLMPLIRGARSHVYLGVGRLAGDRDYDDEDVAAAELLAPHVAGAWRLRALLERSAALSGAACAILDRLEIGLILVDEDMRTFFVNARAETIARAQDGLVLRKSGLAAGRLDETRALHRAVAAALALQEADAGAETVARSGETMSLCLGRRLGAPLIATVVPIAPQQFGLTTSAGRLAGIFIVEPERPPRINVARLAEAYGLARREADLAAALARGIDLAEAAASLGIGIGTARGYLKRVLEKTETRRQAELVALILRGFSHPVRSDAL